MKGMYDLVVYYIIQDFMNKKYRIGAVGYFGDENTAINGQTIRSRMIMKEIIEIYSTDKVKIISYHRWRKEPIRTLFKYLYILLNSDIVIIFPDANAIKVLLPLTVLIQRFIRYRSSYNVIGGWITEFLIKNRRYIKYMKKLDNVFVQTNQLKVNLEKLGIDNITVFPNFKSYGNYDLNEDKFNPPYKLVFFSRVTPQKGINEAIDVVSQLNNDGYKYMLDIYGPIDKKFKNEFLQYVNENSKYCIYKGEIEPTQVPDILSKYFLQLFPTKFSTEGFPGSVLDSFYSGLPVIASNWDSAYEVITEGETGFIFDFNNFDMMKRLLIDIYNNPDLVLEMRNKCVRESKKFDPKKIIKIMVEKL